uniref:Uncharacterized protein n=1 Tax=Oncorhynchus tshawytscha TaxID=74940 RepID=A0AAZ3NQ73_ONCTS
NMADGWSTDTGEAAYRSRDAVKNLTIKLRWRDNTTQIMAQERTRGRWNCRIFTYTDSDCYTNWEGHSQSMVPVTHQSELFFKVNVIEAALMRRAALKTNSSRLITWDPSEDFVKTSHMVNTPVQTIHIMGNLGPAGKLGQKEKECLLCTIRADGNGVVTIKPDFNKGKVPYRPVETEGEKREVWRQTRGDGTATVIMYVIKDYLNSLELEAQPAHYSPSMRIGRG